MSCARALSRLLAGLPAALLAALLAAALYYTVATVKYTVARGAILFCCRPAALLLLRSTLAFLAFLALLALLAVLAGGGRVECFLPLELLARAEESTLLNFLYLLYLQVGAE